MTLTVARARTLLALWRSALDFEAGVLAALRPILARHGVALADDALLEAYGALKLPVERGPFQPFREDLLRTMELFGQRFGFAPTPVRRRYPSCPHPHDQDKYSRMWYTRSR
jgi:hypothetical protein